MRRLTALIPLVALAFVSACSDTTAPLSSADLTPSYVKGANGGGVGSPHFTTETFCTFDSGALADGHNGTIACNFQLGGLAANSSGIGTLVANIQYHYFCNLPGSWFDFTVNTVRIETDVYWYADKKGNARGYVEATPNTDALCGGYAQQKSFDLNLNASAIALPLLTGAGSWALEGFSNTPKGGPVYVYFNGIWTQPQPI